MLSSHNPSAEVDLTWREKFGSLYRVARYRPYYSLAIVVLSVIAAVLEGFGLSFILPIVEVVQAGGSRPAEADGLLRFFLLAYDMLRMPFSLGYLVAGVAVIMTVRFTASFFVGWLRGALETEYTRHLQEEAFKNAIDAEISYFDGEGSDEILNAIVTQAEYGGRVVRFVLHSIEQGLLSLVYIAIALYLAPLLTVLTAIFLGAVIFMFRHVLDTGYSLGNEVADAKEEIQNNAQAGTQGIRDVKLFDLREELLEGFERAVEKFERSRIRLLRNQSAIKNFYQLATAITILVLIYVALRFASLSLSTLSVFLLAMFRFGPKVSNLNRHVYRVEGELPHLVRTQLFIKELAASGESGQYSEPVPDPIQTVAFEDVRFCYNDEEKVLNSISFSVNRGEFAAFVGPSGTGKSTIVSLLARMYEVEDGTITVNDEPIDRFDIDEWRSRVSVVRQDSHIFNDTLWRNVTVGKRDATREEVEHVCEIAQVTEFLDDLPEGFETVLGDRGVKLSGGQRQRVAIARALLKDADLLIFDEATSDFDTELEQSVHHGIENMQRDYAMLVIAHRLSTVTNADRIYTMVDGEIEEVGTHDELLDQAGRYAELYSMQSA